jgi:WS/DGAT/MGAT family acyltransferase
VWVDDEDFDIDRHVTAEGTGAPLDRGELFTLVSKLVSTPLDVRHPLWAIHVIAPLADGGSALLSRMHHALVDGMGGVALAGALLFDAAPDAEPEPVAEWSPAAAPSAGRLLFGGVQDRAAAIGRGVGSLPKRAAGAVRSAPSPAQARESLERAAQTMRRAPGTFRREWLFTAPSDALEGEVGEQRAISLVSWPLERVKSLERAFGRKVTVNDICLSAMGGAIGDWMDQEALERRDVVAKIPVVPHVQDGGFAKGTGGRAPMYVELPVTESDPVERLLEVNRRTHDEQRQEDLAETLTLEQALSHLPRQLADLPERHLRSDLAYNLVITNVPGPPADFYVAGGRVKLAVPLPHLAGIHLLHIAIASLSGTLTVGLVADPEHLPEPGLLGTDLETEMGSLFERASGS